jgi:hypothetical protein
VMISTRMTSSISILDVLVRDDVFDVHDLIDTTHTNTIVNIHSPS